MILDGKKYAECKIEELKNRVQKLEKTPRLAIIQVVGNPASDKYVANKMKRCSEVGIKCDVYKLPQLVTTTALGKLIEMLNDDNDIDGILLQLPLPQHLDELYLTNLIKPEKDVDGFTISNTGKLSVGVDGFVSCTPKGIIDLLKFYDIPMKHKDVLIINRSNIVGKPLTQLFLKEDATVTIAHSKTLGIKEKIWKSDIVVTAVGIPDFIDEKDFKNDTTIIDVSINFKDGKMCGDISREDVEKLKHRCNITPVPGGVGQTTVISLLDNVISTLEK